MTFLKYKISFYLFVFVLFAACKQAVPSKYDRIQSLLVDSLNIRKDYKAILVLEDGSCPSCQKALNAFMLQHIDNEDILFVVSNDERFVDLSELKTINKENLIIDNKKLFYNKNIIEDSAVLVFKEKQLDTILVLSNSDVLQENLNYFSSLVYP
ncbi:MULTISPECIES: hypothetical protein [Myroides]|uniref:hypothetical protein n=1 Tax=Myroides odoratus TaxID=256 RepID=UPI0024BFDE35|nr:hypothetical protein [Myroides sp. mNGS23_01]WHT40463.1 hypothetical protein QNH98_07835 [Myroides sp. mNGS23_01]